MKKGVRSQDLPAFLVSVVLNDSDGSISLVQAVHAFHNISVTGFMLRLLVAGVWVLYFVLELVFRM